MHYRFTRTLLFVFLITFCLFLTASRDDFSGAAFLNLQNSTRNSINQPTSSNTDSLEDDAVYTFNNYTSELSITSVGDIMFHMQQITAAEENGTYNFNPMFSDVKDLISSSDLAVGNFETTIDPYKRPAGYPCFNAPVQALEAIKAAGFDVLLTANNHSYDTGVEGLRTTSKLVKQYGFMMAGTGEPLEEKSILIEKNNIKVGITDYTYGTNFGFPNKDMINYIDESKIRADVDRLKSKCDFIIVYLHIGNEYVRTVEAEQSRIVNNIAKMGVDAILCSHPHVTRKTEMLNINGKEVLVNYSMGNFVSNMDDKYTDMGSVTNIVLEKSGYTTKIKYAETIPVYRLRYTKDGKRIVKAVAFSDIAKYNSLLSSNTVSYIEQCSKEISYKYSPSTMVFSRSRIGSRSAVQ